MKPNPDLAKFGTLPNTRQDGDLELRLRCLIRVFRSFFEELRSNSRLPWKTRFKAWRLGFSSSSWEIYNLDENDPSLYLPDMYAVRNMYRVNGFFHPVVGNKLVLPQLLAAQNVRHPTVVSHMLNGRMIVEDEPFEPDVAKVLERTLERFPRQVFRPTWAGNGQGVFFLERNGDELQLNGAPITMQEAGNLVGKLHRYVATEFQQQAGYAAAIFPGSTNTLRVVTLWDSESGDSMIAAVVHRFGSSRSGKVDNFQSGYGGVCAVVDADNSTMGKAVMRDANQKVAWVSAHPETDAPIEGVVVPHLQECLRVLLEVANRFPYCPWIGWDVVITEEGYSILEANTLPNVAVSQSLHPFLRDPRSRRIFERWGLVR